MDDSGDHNFEVRYYLKRRLSPQEERDLLEFIDPYASSYIYDMDTRRLMGFGIYRYKDNDFFWAQVQELGDDDYDD